MLVPKVNVTVVFGAVGVEKAGVLVGVPKRLGKSLLCCLVSPAPPLVGVKPKAIIIVSNY